jgi:preprotein translocase subunit SecA
VKEALAVFEAREEELTPAVMRQIEQRVVLSIIDNKWREHLSEMDYLRAGIGLRAIGQRDPLTEYQREGYEMFSDLVASVKRDAIRYLFHVEVAETQAQPKPKAMVTSGPRKIQQAESQKVGRNAPCPCGSGIKAKRCSNTPTCLAS